MNNFQYATYSIQLKADMCKKCLEAFRESCDRPAPTQNTWVPQIANEMGCSKESEIYWPWSKQQPYYSISKGAARREVNSRTSEGFGCDFRN